MLKQTYAKIGQKVVSSVVRSESWNNGVVASLSNQVTKRRNNRFVSAFILFAQRLNENFELTLFKERLVPGMNVVDIGANFGLYSLVAGKELASDGHVFAFEPEPDTFGALDNVLKRKEITNVTLFRKALSDKKGKTKLYFDGMNVGGHSLSEKNPYKSSSYFDVETDTLDNIFSDTKVDLIKIDTQGAEGLVMVGGKKMLERDRPVVFLEFWPNGMSEFPVDSTDLLKIFSKLNYKILVIDKIKRDVYEVDEKTLFSMCSNKKHENDFVDIILEP